MTDWGVVVIAVCTAVTAVFSYLARRDTAMTRNDVAEVKTHTNSMKDALVAQATIVGRAEGIEAERSRGVPDGV
jgi:hypothetical protein